MKRLNISLSPEQLIVLFEANILHPSQVHCLDGATRDAIKQMCLELCQPHNCQACLHHAHCAKTLYSAPVSAPVGVSIPSLVGQTLN
ncbi:hypothetical protein [Thiomicrorhabdus aquaedulcis]|uniref:hypothetical protein n=1 Tax=Thiomicrorhabdus aquaedulcis TaxID=2211106 RepID=UPI000FD88C31|nr:hypothetical protein [Thiomicrorhabdus aquaedulcis]